MTGSAQAELARSSRAELPHSSRAESRDAGGRARPPSTPLGLHGRRPALGAGLVLLLLTACAPTLVWSGRDAERQAMAEVLSESNQQWLRTGSRDGARYDAVGLEGIVFAPVGGRVAYPAIREGQWFVVTDAQTLGPYVGVAELQFSADGARVAFAAQTREGWRVVIDGAPGPAFEDLQPRTLQFSRSGTHTAYVGRSGRCATLVIDGEARPCVERVLALRVTDAGTVAATVREGGKDRFLFGDAPGPAFDAIGGWVVTEDGAHHAYAARQGKRWVPVVDGVAWSDCARVSHLRFGDLGKKVAWVCAEGGTAALVVDGAAGPRYPAISAPVLGEDTPDVAYVAQDPNGAWVIAGDSTWGPFAEVRDLLVQGGRVAFVARSNGLTRVVHGQAQTPLPAVVDGSLVLSARGDHWAVIAGDPAARELWIAVDGAKLRAVAAEDVFGESGAALQRWLTRELREATR